MRFDRDANGLFRRGILIAARGAALAFLLPGRSRHFASPLRPSPARNPLFLHHKEGALSCAL
jgi:hypothetical protein